jgi:hypothetical protein
MEAADFSETLGDYVKVCTTPKPQNITLWINGLGLFKTKQIFIFWSSSILKTKATGSSEMLWTVCKFIRCQKLEYYNLKKCLRPFLRNYYFATKIPWRWRQQFLAKRLELPTVYTVPKLRSPQCKEMSLLQEMLSSLVSRCEIVLFSRSCSWYSTQNKKLSSYYRILTMVYIFQRYWVFGLYPSSWY